MPYECSVEDGIFVARARGVLKMDDVATLAEEEDRYFAMEGSKRLFLCEASDLKVIAPEAADALVMRMRINRERIVRAAVVVGDGTSALQVSRLIRAEGSERRRAFTSVDQALAWLRSAEAAPE